MSKNEIDVLIDQVKTAAKDFFDVMNYYMGIAQKLEEILNNHPQQAILEYESLCSKNGVDTQVCLEGLRQDAADAALLASVKPDRPGLKEEASKKFEIYRREFEIAFGITITEDAFAGSINQLEYSDVASYHLGADAIATLLKDIFCGKDVDCIDKYALFQAVMGDIEVRRVSSRERISERGNAYTSGQTLYDIFDEERLFPVTSRIPNYTGSTSLTSTNFAHELGHIFLTRSGLGNVYGSPLTVLEVRELITSALSNSSILRENPNPEFVEYVADFIMNLTNLLPLDAYRTTPEMGTAPFSYPAIPLSDETRLWLGRSINSAILYGTPPENVASAFGTTDLQQTTLSGIAVRYNSPSNLSQISDGVILFGEENVVMNLSGQNVTFLGRTPVEYTDDRQVTRRWLYIAVDMGNGQYRYGWIREDTVTGIDFSSLPSIDFGDTDLFTDSLSPVVGENGTITFR
ncbi:MAG: hypothetical protein K8L91_00865 [Anaerolineae bacterium]|nr:hypothetical protein [Anaerolineae bacterium]